MNKKYLIIGLLGISMLAHATSSTVFSGLYCNNTYDCSLPLNGVSSDTEITDCTFTFTSVKTHSAGLLSCNLKGGSSECNLGSQSGSTSSWTCTLDANGLKYLNDCIASGKCDFNLDCGGNNYHIGSCQVDYTCKPVPKNCPDTAMTIYLFGLTLLGVELSRRKFATAKTSAK